MSYRDPVEALQSRRERIAADLAEARRAAEQVLESARRVGHLEKELAATEKLLAASGPHRSLPLLDQLHVAAPCSASWDEMTGDDRVRHCAHCDKNVYDLSAMTRDEAEAFVAGREGTACVRFYRRTDGTVLTSDCPVGVRRRRRRRVVAATFGGGVVAAALSYGTGTTVPGSALLPGHYMGAAPMLRPPVERQVMGEMVVTPRSVDPRIHATSEGTSGATPAAPAARQDPARR